LPDTEKVIEKADTDVLSLCIYSYVMILLAYYSNYAPDIGPVILSLAFLRMRLGSPPQIPVWDI
jgi:hypothetical protein